MIKVRLLGFEIFIERSREIINATPDAIIAEYHLRYESNTDDTKLMAGALYAIMVSLTNHGIMDNDVDHDALRLALLRRAK